MDKPAVRRRKNLGVLGMPNVYSFYTLFLMWAICAVFYYFGEIVELAHWETLRWQFFYSVHDVHRLLFLAPIVYAAYIFGIKATIMLTIISLITFLPRALFISPYPDPLARMLIFIFVAGIIGYLSAIVRRESRRRARLETTLTSDREQFLEILGRMHDYVFIISPDYQIRYMNESMIKEFGKWVGLYCNQCLTGFDESCRQSHGLVPGSSSKIQRWDYQFPDGRTFEVQASPYRDNDGVVCQLMVFRKTTRNKETGTKSEESTV